MMNGAFALAFSTPLARLFGPKIEGGLLFFGFYLLTGVLANLAFAALHPGSPVLVVGASGAVSGLMGASGAPAGWRRGAVGPIFSRPVISLGGAWLGINILMALAPPSLLPGAGSAGVAWEAHLAGFALGVLLVSPFAWLAPRGDGGA